MTAVASPEIVVRPPRGPELAQGPRFATLDGLRGLAILGVMCLHFVPPRSSGGGLFKALWFGSNAGGTGVDLFFVLSGFLITGILYDAKKAANYFRAFYMRRVLRIFPLYYAILIGVFLVAGHIVPLSSVGLEEPQKHQFWLWLYGTNIAENRGISFGCFDHFWSLAIEEQFYLVWPLAVLLLGRRSLIWLLIACCVATVGARVVAIHHDLLGLLSPRGIEALAAGSLVALLSRGPGGATRFLSVSARVALAVIPIAGVLYLLRSGHGDSWMQVLKPLFLAWMYATLVALAVLSAPASLLGTALTWRPLRQMGKLSYAMYALHMPAGMLLERRFPQLRQLATPLHSVLAGAIAKMLIEIAVSLALAWLSWHLFEKHFLRLKRLFEYRYPARDHERAAPVKQIEPVIGDTASASLV